MGGSHLAADLIKCWKADVNIYIHKNYGLPRDYSLPQTLFIISSHSGNTEETVDSFQKIIKKKLPAIVLSTGGRLLELAQKNKTPYIQIPPISMQSRLAIGFSCKAILAAMREEKALKELDHLGHNFHPARLENIGRQLAGKIKHHIPLVYASEENFGLALIWKTRFNETGKTPAFCNFFPELNHNEMAALSSGFHYLFIRDNQDVPRIKKRMRVLKTILKKREQPVEELVLRGRSRWEKLFNSLILADWTSFYTALQYDYDPEGIPLIEEFKKIIK